MEKASLWPLLLISLSGALAQTSLEGTVFIFPQPSDTAYVRLRPTLNELLQQFTICLRFFTDLISGFSLFSCASREQDNEILLFKTSPTNYQITVGGESVMFTVPANVGRSVQWETVCVTWKSTTGMIQLWLDGQPLPRKGVAKGYMIKTEVVMMLGQDQDSYGGSLDSGQAFVGEMAEVYMWNTVLPPEHLRTTRKDSAPTPLVDWTALKFDIEGYVVMEPATD